MQFFYILAVLIFSSILNAASVQTFTNDFSTDTTSGYITEDTWTKGGVGSFGYDSAGEHVQVATGNDVALKFSADLSPSTEGSFSINFLPTAYYPSGGIFSLKLIEDANTYYQIENTDNYGAREIATYVNNVKVDSRPFSGEYTQGVNYTISVSFTPDATTVEAFGETLMMNSDNSPITVSSFSIETTQQDAFYDNIVYTIVQTGTNTPPTANAGVDKSIQVNQTINIIGIGTDTDGNITAYEWKKGSTVLATTAAFDYTPDTVGIDTLTLTVTDNNGSTGTDSMDVNVTAEPVPNTAPIADAGIDQNVDTGSVVILDGSGSSDAQNDTLSYQWNMTDRPLGSSAVLSDSSAVNPTFVADLDGTYTLTLIVNDGSVESAVDTVVVTAVTSSSTSAFSDDFSTDTTSGYITEDTWTKGGVGSFGYDSAGERVQVATGNDVALKFSADLSPSTEGSFSINFLPTAYYPSGGIFSLKLIEDANTYYQIENTDNYGAREIATYVNNVKVDSRPFSGEYTQGVNYTISVSFTPDATTVEAFGETLMMNSDNSPITVSSFSIETTQQDAFYDNIVYTIVQTGTNTPPTANAGVDKSIQVNQTINIIGIGTDTDGNITAYEWKKGSTVLATTAAFDYTPDTVGIDTLTLTVTDNNGSTGTDSMDVNVTAEPVPNTAPIADAGIDQNVDTGSVVILDGSGSSDAQNDTLSYQWNMTDRPLGSSAVLSDSSAVNPTFVADLDGTYTLTLIVNDGSVESAVDTVVVTAVTSSSTSAFSDDFSTDTTSGYITEDTWTKGGVGSFGYDSAGERVQVATGNDVALKFSADLSPSTEGSFSINFLPTAYYPSGGIFSLKLIEDANTYYQIENTDNYGAREIATYVNNVKVDSRPFSGEYTQGVNYTISVSFTPDATTVEAFGETLMMNSDNSPITVSSFSIETTQQDAFYDNIVYTIVQTGTNTPPTANAGVDKSIQVNQTINIIGIGTDTDGNITAYEWKKGSTVLATTAAFDYTPDTVGIDILTLTVTDNNGSTGTDSMDVNVTAEPVPNTAPIADAGIDQNVDTGSVVILDGSGSSDAQNDTLSYQWNMTDRPLGSSAVLSDSSAVNPTFVADLDGTYTLTLIVNDGSVESAVDTVVVTAVTSSSTSAFSDDFSTDTTSGYITEDTWTKGGVGSFGYDSAGERVQVATGNDVALKFSADLSPSTEGSFSINFLPTAYYPSGGIFSLKLIEDANTYYQIENTDNYGAREIATYVNNVKVDSRPFSGEYTQGVNYTISVSFTPDATTVEAFGETLMMNSDNSPITVSSFSIETTQQDAFYDNIVYTIVQTGTNTPPTANAGVDKSIQVNQTINIIGIGTDTDGNITAYEWKKGSTVLATTAAFDYTPDTVGIDTLTLTVTDNNGSTGTDSMDVNVTAEPVPNTAPIADAGIDQNVDTGSVVILDGSGSSDAQNDTLSYQWNMTDRPLGSSAVLSDSSAVNPTFVADLDGTYTLTLIVNDGSVESAVDTVVVTAVTSSSTSAFSDDFSTDTTSGYITEDTWTKGGVGSFGYDSAGERVQVATGNDVALKFSADLSPSTEGSFSINFLPTAYYPSGGIFSLKLIEDANTYYQIENTDNYGAREIATYVNNVKVDSRPFSGEYTQGVNYTISVSFTPDATTVEAFGETLMMNSDNSPITVSSFSIETTQQDAFYDNIVYSVQSSLIRLITPLTNHIQSDENLTVEVITDTLAVGWGVKFIVDESSINEQVIVDMIPPYKVIFSSVSESEHSVDCYIIDELQNEQVGKDNHVGATNIGIGDIYIAVGDSITLGYGDDLISDNISLDGRNSGGGYTPILNDYLTTNKGYPHTIINEGISGETTQEGYARLPSILSSYPDANTYLLMYGTNNTSPIASQPLESGKSLFIGDIGYEGTFKDYIQKMIDMINSAGKKVVIAKIAVALGTSSGTGDYTLPITGDEYRNIKAGDFNQAIEELVADPNNHIMIVGPDFYSYFIDNHTDEYFDNLHPNGLGYNSMAELWGNVLIE